MYRSPTLNNLEFDLSRSLEVKYDGAILDPHIIYGFLLIFNSNIWPNAAPVHEDFKSK